MKTFFKKNSLSNPLSKSGFTINEILFLWILAIDSQHRKQQGERTEVKTELTASSIVDGDADV